MPRGPWADRLLKSQGREYIRSVPFKGRLGFLPFPLPAVTGRPPGGEKRVPSSASGTTGRARWLLNTFTSHLLCQGGKLWCRGADLPRSSVLCLKTCLYSSLMAGHIPRSGRLGLRQILSPRWLSTQFCSLPVPFFLMDKSGDRAGSLIPRIHHPTEVLSAQLWKHRWVEQPGCPVKTCRGLGFGYGCPISYKSKEREKKANDAGAIMLWTNMTCLWILWNTVFINGKTWEVNLITFSIILNSKTSRGFPGGPGVKNLLANAGRRQDRCSSGRSPGEGNGITLAFLSRQSHGQRSLSGCCPWGPRESDR